MLKAEDFHKIIGIKGINKQEFSNLLAKTLNLINKSNFIAGLKN